MSHSKAIDIVRETKVRPGKTGIDLLHDPLLNKGTAFTQEERLKLGIQGLLPPQVSTLEQQSERVLKNIRARASSLGKYVEMIALMDRNETLFYRVVRDNIEEIMPIIYTPVVGHACQVYAHIYRRSRGIFLTRHDKGHMREVLRNWPQRDIRVIVVTDGQRILGLGDLGANGMGIPVGKLSLYTACGGVHPAQTLPVTLDVGTNNEELLADPLYLGVREKRIEGRKYDELIEEFVSAVQEVFPKALIQFEDFANHNAFRLLQKYRSKACVFNDDIQGTAAVTLAGLYSAGRLAKKRLTDMKILFHGAGEAAIGIGDLIIKAMVAEGVSKKEAMSRCWFMDSKGLVQSERTDLQDHKKAYAHNHPPIQDLLTAVKELKPTALIGVSAQPGQFKRPIIEAMTQINPTPVIFALSNPTANSECTAEEAYAWSNGKAIFASGSPFNPVTLNGKTFVPGQGNNAYIFPGVGLGAVVCGAKRITDDMFLEAARALARFVPEESLKQGCLYPPLTSALEVSARIAAATAEVAYRENLTTQRKPRNLLEFVRSMQYQPVYPKYA